MFYISRYITKPIIKKKEIDSNIIKNNKNIIKIKTESVLNNNKKTINILISDNYILIQFII